MNKLHLNLELVNITYKSKLSFKNLLFKAYYFSKLSSDFVSSMFLDEPPLTVNFFSTGNTERWGLVTLNVDKPMKVDDHTIA